MRGLALALVASPALAEGARQTFDCRATLACDGAGACAASDEAVTFTLDPVEVGPRGDGTFTVRYAREEAEALATFQPFEASWAEGDDAHRLLLGGATADGRALLLWHASRDAGRASLLRFLSCDVLQ